MEKETKKTVLEMLERGVDPKEIASECGVSIRTVAQLRRFADERKAQEQEQTPAPEPGETEVSAPELPVKLAAHASEPPTEKGKAAAMLMMLELASQMLADMGAEVDAMTARGMDTVNIIGTRADSTIDITLKIIPTGVKKNAEN